MIDGNWALFGLTGMIALGSIAVVHGVMRGQIQKMEDSMQTFVARGEYESRQKAQEHEIEEIKKDIRENHAMLITLISRVDRMDAHIGMVLDLLKKERKHDG